ncbi:hypothetical protein NKDENANG_00391 [Candidatus Entotheonellaceae bacterium PAL068K]
MWGGGNTRMSRVDLTAALRRLTDEMTYSAYLAVANTLAKSPPESTSLPCLRVAVLRNFTVEPLIPVIQGEIARAGFYPEIYLGAYDAIMQDALDPDSALYAFQPDFIMVMLWLDTLAPTLATRFLALSLAQVQTEVRQVLDTVDEVLSGLRRHTDVPILCNNFPLPLFPTQGILDAQSEHSQMHSILKLNQELLHCQRQRRNVYMVDYMSLLARLGSMNGIDERHWQIGSAPLGRHVLVSCGREYGKFFRALRGKSHKCLVLDCDNTLWGGVVGEDGIGGIQLGASYPGSCYQAFQREILNLHDRGVILALCSKNNEQDVLDVLRTHPEMLLREEHFATWQINWDDKATNLMHIARDLNIGLDSLVFVDDSEFECGLVCEQLPQVAVLHLASDPSMYRSQLGLGGYFDTLSVSAEDRKRTQMYRAEVQRQQLYQQTHSLEEYLAKLELVAEIGQADSVTIPRIAQLTQKTNQFNLTTRRYSEGDIQTFVDSPHADVFYLKLRDRIAELGLVGVAIVTYSDHAAELDTFLFSCRALGRGAEDAFLAHVLNAATARGCRRVLGRYWKTAKNGQVKDFYTQRGFCMVAENAQGSDWELSLTQDVVLTPNWIKVELIA